MFFEVLVEEGHRGRAAERLGRTTPAVTKCVRRLEQEIGAPLFHRVGRRSTLTQTGATLLRHAKHLHSAMDDALKDVSASASGLAGHVRVGMGTTIVDYLLPQLRNWFLSESPDASVEIRIGHGDILRSDLAEGRLDGIVTSFQPSDSEHFTIQTWFTDEVVVAACKEHPLAGKRIHIADLLKYGWVLPRRTVSSRQWIDSAFKSRGLPPPNVRAEVSSARLVSTFVEKSDLLSFIPRRSLEPGRLADSLKELRLEATTMRRTLGLLYRPSAYILPTLKRLADVLRSGLANSGSAADRKFIRSKAGLR